MGRRRRGRARTWRSPMTGSENLKELIAIHKDTPSIIEKCRQALAAMMKPKTEESDEI